MRKMNRILIVKSILFPSLGLICILFSDRVTLLLPYLLGSAMVLVGTLMLVSYFKEKKFFEKQSIVAQLSRQKSKIFIMN